MSCPFLDQRLTKLRDFLRIVKKSGDFESFKVEKRYTSPGGDKHEKYAISVFDPKDDATYYALQQMILFYLPNATKIVNYPDRVQVSTQPLSDGAVSAFGMLRVSDVTAAKVFKKLQDLYQNPSISQDEIDLILKTYL